MKGFISVPLAPRVAISPMKGVISGRGEHEHGDGGGFRGRFQPLEHVHAAHDGQGDVEEDQVRPGPLDGEAGIVAVADFVHVAVEGPERLLDHETQALGIIDGENGGTHGGEGNRF